MESLERTIMQHPFFSGLEERVGKLTFGCAKNVRFEAGQYIFHEGDAADQFYLLRHGKVALQLSMPARGAVTFHTLGDGDVFGLTWMIPPHRRAYDAKALDLTRAVAIDAACLRQKCEADPRLGYELMKRFVQALMGRLHTTQLQLLDIYAVDP